MDERDFAELISVFLKGSEPSTTPDAAKKEASDSSASNSTSSNEAEIRKNIIEALAEKIKESQDITQSLKKTPYIPRSTRQTRKNPESQMWNRKQKHRTTS